jgi:hypothetical protein
LFENLHTIASSKCMIVLTYPSPQYQTFLATHQPDELQVIDNIVELPDLCREAAQGGFSLQHYSLETVWRCNQYVHCIFQLSDDLGERIDVMNTPKVPNMVTTVSGRVVRRWRRWKYVDRVFGAFSGQ